MSDKLKKSFKDPLIALEHSIHLWERRAKGEIIFDVCPLCIYSNKHTFGNHRSCVECQKITKFDHNCYGTPYYNYLETNVKIIKMKHAKLMLDILKQIRNDFCKLIDKYGDYPSYINDN